MRQRNAGFFFMREPPTLPCCDPLWQSVPFEAENLQRGEELCLSCYTDEDVELPLISPSSSSATSDENERQDFPVENSKSPAQHLAWAMMRTQGVLCHMERFAFSKLFGMDITEFIFAHRDREHQPQRGKSSGSSSAPTPKQMKKAAAKAAALKNGLGGRGRSAVEKVGKSAEMKVLKRRPITDEFDLIKVCQRLYSRESMHGRVQQLSSSDTEEDKITSGSSSRIAPDDAVERCLFGPGIETVAQHSVLHYEEPGLTDDCDFLMPEDFPLGRQFLHLWVEDHKVLECLKLYAGGHATFGPKQLEVELRCGGVRGPPGLEREGTLPRPNSFTKDGEFDFKDNSKRRARLDVTWQVHAPVAEMSKKTPKAAGGTSNKPAAGSAPSLGGLLTEPLWTLAILKDQYSYKVRRESSISKAQGGFLQIDGNLERVMQRSSAMWDAGVSAMLNADSC
eukprot:g7593.t1